MIAVYAVVLAAGVTALLAWIFMAVLGSTNERPRIDPEHRFGVLGRRFVAAAVGFGMAGMSAEYSARDIAWPIALVLAIVGAGAAAWWAGRVGLEPGDDD